MGKIRKYRIYLKVDPMVRRFIENNFKEQHGAYDSTGTVYHSLVVAMLSHSDMKAKSLVSRKYDGFVPVTLLISEFDFYHYGYVCSELQQVWFSRSVRKMIIDDICRKAALAKVLLGQPVTKTIEHYIIDMCFDDTDVNAETIRKFYNRKYKDYESRLLEFYRDLVSDFGANDIDIEKKSLLKMSQAFF